MNIPGNLFYTKEHEWVRIEGELATMGITDHAQEALGDITFVELPKIGQEVKQSEFCATVESVKAASDVYAPVSGVITKINAEIVGHSEYINESPYDKGWFTVIRMRDPAEKDTLMNAGQYAEYLKGIK